MSRNIFTRRFHCKPLRDANARTLEGSPARQLHAALPLAGAPRIAGESGAQLQSNENKQREASKRGSCRLVVGGSLRPLPQAHAHMELHGNDKKIYKKHFLLLSHKDQRLCPALPPFRDAPQGSPATTASDA